MRAWTHALVLTLALAPGCRTEVVAAGPGGDCPTDQPVAGDTCNAPATCQYPGTPCDEASSCVDGAWQSPRLVCPPGSCPEALPTVGAPCKAPGQACPFTFPGPCGGMFVATCDPGGQWAVADHSPPCMPPPCPTDAPDAGAPCAAGEACTYTVTTPGCPPQTVDATCESGAWKVEDPMPCMP